MCIRDRYVIATNIYSLTKDKLVWSGVTASTNAKKLDKLVKGLSLIHI